MQYLRVLHSPAKPYGGLRETPPNPVPALFCSRPASHGSDLLAKLEMGSEFPTGMFSFQTELCFKHRRMTEISATVME